MMAYINSYGTTTKKYDNKELGKIFKTYYGDSSFATFHEFF